MKKPHWTDEETAFLIANYGSMKDSELAKILNKTQKAIVQKRHYMSLYKESGRGIVSAKN